MTSYVGNHNFTAGCHNMAIDIQNFKKVELQTLNACWKAVATWSNQMGRCNFSTSGAVYKEFFYILILSFWALSANFWF